MQSEESISQESGERRLISGLDIGVDETSTVEFKMRLCAKMAEKNLNAFLNSQGGQILFGIHDDGTILGIPLSQSERDDFVKLLQQFMSLGDPKVHANQLDVSFHHVYTKDGLLKERYGDYAYVVCCRVEKGEELVYKTSLGICWGRYSASTRLMKRAQILSRIAPTKRLKSDIVAGCFALQALEIPSAKIKKKCSFCELWLASEQFSRSQWCQPVNTRTCIPCRIQHQRNALKNKSFDELIAMDEKIAKKYFRNRNLSSPESNRLDFTLERQERFSSRSFEKRRQQKSDLRQSKTGRKRLRSTLSKIKCEVQPSEELTPEVVEVLDIEKEYAKLMASKKQNDIEIIVLD